MGKQISVKNEEDRSLERRRLLTISYEEIIDFCGLGSFLRRFFFVAAKKLPNTDFCLPEFRIPIRVPSMGSFQLNFESILCINWRVLNNIKSIWKNILGRLTRKCELFVFCGN